MENVQNWCESSCHEVALDLFATNKPDPPHWTLNSCFGVFRIIWGRLGLFGCVTTPSVKRVKLVKNFVPWCPIGIFCNERTRSTPLDPKLMFWSFFYYLGAFGTIWFPYKTRCKTGQNWCKSSCQEVASEFFATKAPDPPHWTPNSYFGVFHTIWVHLGPFGCLTTLSAKRVKLVQKFVPQVALEFFAMNASDSPHWTLNSCFRAFCTIWVHLGLFGCLPILSAKHVKLVQKFVPRSRVGIFPTNAPDPPHWTLNSCSGAFHTNFAAFGTVWLARKNSVQNGPTGAKVRATKSRRKFSQRTHPILLIGL